jgi:Leucine-rich repeat (LRR) protein
MERVWNTIDDMNNDMKNMETFNQIKSLTIYGNFNFSLPTALTCLSCRGNELSNLPELPNKLQRLYCSHNQLSSLPKLPNTLTSLYCHYNKLLSLPNLPNKLTHLDCSNNRLSSLPKLPNTLTYLDCRNNQLLSLPELNQNLFTINYSNNPFNLWSALIDPTKINTEYAEIICEKLNIINNEIKDFENELNTIDEIDDEEILDEDDYNQKVYEFNSDKKWRYNGMMSYFKKEIDKILNLKFEIIL